MQEKKEISFSCVGSHTIGQKQFQKSQINRIWNRKRSGISYCYFLYFVTFLTQILQICNFQSARVFKFRTFLHTPFLYIVFMYPYPVQHHLRPSIGASSSLFGQTSLFLALTCRALVFSAPYLTAPGYFRPTTRSGLGASGALDGRASVLYYSPIE